MKRLKLFLCIAMGVLAMSGCGNHVPNEKQLKSDFIERKLLNEDISVTTFSIESEEKNEDQYMAIANVVYDNEEVEYTRQYEFIYTKNDEWQLDDINAFNENDWDVIPLACPDITEFKDKCLNRVLETLYDRDFEYDSFEPVEEKTKEDLDNEKTTFVYSVNNKTEIQEISGEIEFELMFNKEDEKWEIENFSYMDSYKEEYDLVRTWRGVGYPYKYEDEEKYKVDFELEVTKCENEDVEAVLKYNKESYYLSGTFKDTGANFVELNLTNEEEKKSVQLYVYFDGSAEAIKIDTLYTPSDTGWDIYYVYTKTLYYNVKMGLK